MISYTELISNLDHLKIYNDYYNKVYNGTLRFRKNFLSPFRSERDPSFGIYKKQEKILWKDFAADGGDVITFVMKIENISFIEACKKILSEYTFKTERTKQKVSEVFNTKIKSEEEELIDIVPLTSGDIDLHKTYLDRFLITKYCLSTTGIIPIRSYHIVYYTPDKKYKRYVEVELKETDLCFYIPYKEVSVFCPKCKIYTPGKKPKMIGNTKQDDVFYLGNSLSDTCYIMAGHKDALAFKSLLADIGYSDTVCCLNSESCLTIPLTKNGDQFNQYYIFYDDDKTGKTFSEKLKILIEFTRQSKAYIINWDGIKKMFLTYITPDELLNIKDLSDLTEIASDLRKKIPVRFFDMINPHYDKNLPF
jgi:hypothetical protein